MYTRNPKHKTTNKSFKIRAAMLALDEYLRIYILPQIPAEYKDYRDIINQSLNKAWHAIYHAALTEKRERQKKLLELKIELMIINAYLEEILHVCYRGKMRRNLNKNAMHRFEVCAKKQKDVMAIVWGWLENEAKKMDPKRSQSTSGLTEVKLD